MTPLSALDEVTPGTPIPPGDPRALLAMLLSGANRPTERQRPEPERQPVEFPADAKTRLARLLRRYYDEAGDSQEDQEQQRTYKYRRYLADPSLRAGLQPWPGAPQLFLPMTRSTIESLKTNLAAELFETIDKIEVKGVGKEDEPAAARAKLFFHWWLESIVNIRRLCSDVMLDALIDALAVVKCYPYTNPYPPLHEDAIHFQTEARMESVDLSDMLIPPDAVGLQFPEARYLGHKMRIHPDTLLDMERRGFKVPDLDELTKENARSLDEEEFTEDERKWVAFSRMGIDPTPDFPDPNIEVVEWYILFAPKEGEQREFFVVHWMPNVRGMQGEEYKNGLIMRVVRLEDAIPQHLFSRPTWPFFDLKVWPQPRQLYGMDVPTRLESLQDILNRQAEQMLNDGDISVLPFYFYTAALTGELPDLTEVRPGSGVPIDNAGQVFFPPRQSNNRHYAEQMTWTSHWAERDSNVTAFTQGRSSEQPNAPRTLGGQQLLLDASSRVFNEQTQLLADMWKPILMMAFAIWQNRLPESVKIPMPDLQGIEERLLDGTEAPMVMKEVRHSDLQGLFDIQIKIDPEAMIKQQRQLQLAGMLDQIIAPIWPLGRRELWKQLWALMKLQDFDRVWPEQVGVVQTQILIMQAELTMAQLEMQLAEVQQAQAMQAAQALLAALAQGAGGTDRLGGQNAQGQTPSGQRPGDNQHTALQGAAGTAGGVQGPIHQAQSGPPMPAAQPPQNRSGR